jgi:nitronate monooxygenase
LALRTPLTDILGIRHPILLAPMGAVAGGALAAAVTRAGGLGIVGAGYGDRAWLERELAATGNERIGVGFITWSLARDPALLQLALERKPALLFLSFGDAKPFIEPIKASGAKLVLQVQDLAGARAAAELGADIVVAQGSEAGGHGKTRRALFPLLPAVVDALAPLPVVAAGGIADPRQLAACLLLGAAGVLVGTRLYAAEESLGHANAKARIREAGGDETLRTRVFDILRGYDWPEGYTGRAIANETTKRWDGHEDTLAGHLSEAQARYRAAAEAGDVDQTVIFAGEGLDLIPDLKPAEKIIAKMAIEAELLLARAIDLIAPQG